MEKKLLGPKLVFCHFLKVASLYFLILLILHRIAAWDNVQDLVELKPPKQIVAKNDLFYLNVVEHPLKHAYFH